MGCGVTFAKQKYAAPSGITEYCLVITLGVMNVRWTAHFEHDPVPFGNWRPVEVYRLEMLPPISTRRKCMGSPRRRGSARLQIRWATASYDISNTLARSST